MEVSLGLISLFLYASLEFVTSIMFSPCDRAPSSGHIYSTAVLTVAL